MVKYAAALYSGGKDSTYSLHLAYLQGYVIKCLLIIKPPRDSELYHTPYVNLTLLQADALGLPFIRIKGDGMNALRRTLTKLKKDYPEVKYVITGALRSDYQRMRFNFIASEFNLKVTSPLWRKNQEEYLRDVVRHGIRFTLTFISVKGLPPKYIGKVIDEKDVEEIIMLSKIHGFNPAFEGGEAETLVLDAPLFRKKLVLEDYEVVREWEYVYRLLIKRIRVVEK